VAVVAPFAACAGIIAGMNAGAPDTPLLIPFLLASLVLAATPGPGVLYIVARTLAHGRSAGLASVLGVMLGNLGNALAAALGLAALLAVSATAFTVLKWAGAAYLVYLGVQALRPARAATASVAPASPPWPSVLRDGFWEQPTMNTPSKPPRAVLADDERLMREQLRARLAEVWPELQIVAEARTAWKRCNWWPSTGPTSSSWTSACRA
jgi:hypothetical protein